MLSLHSFCVRSFYALISPIPSWPILRPSLKINLLTLLLSSSCPPPPISRWQLPLFSNCYPRSAFSTKYQFSSLCAPKPLPRIACKATQVSVSEESPKSDGGGGQVRIGFPVVPLAALPKGERCVIIQDGEIILLLWYKDQVFAIENRSPAEGAYSEGLLNAKLTQNGCIVCPTTDSTFSLENGAIKDWYPSFEVPVCLSCKNR